MASRVCAAHKKSIITFHSKHVRYLLLFIGVYRCLTEHCTLTSLEIVELSSLAIEAIQWIRILKMGRRGDNNNNNDKHWTRIKSALTTKTAFTPPLYGLPKDHKKLQEGREDQGHPVRPVCGATESMNGPLSDVLSGILTTLGDEMDETIDTLCLSTEGMCHALKTFNQKVSEDHQNNIKEPVIFSMDVAAIIPSLDIAEVARACERDQETEQQQRIC